MSPIKSNENIRDDEHTEYTRLPLRSYSKMYPNLQAEKENIVSSSTDNSPEKNNLDSQSPKLARKSNSPLSADTIQDATNAPRRRSGRYQSQVVNEVGNVQKNYPDRRHGRDSDGDMEMDYDNGGDDIEYNNDPSFNSQNDINCHGKYKVSKEAKIKKNVSPSPKIPKASLEAQRRFNLSEMQSQSTFSSDNTSNNFWQEYSIFIIVSVLFFTVCLVIFINGRYFHQNSYENKQLNVRNLVNSLKEKFNDQPSLTFRIVGSALKNVVDAQPQSPAIILLLAANGSKAICDEFASTLVNLLSPDCHVQISGEDYRQANVNNGKLKIDQLIEGALDTKKLGSVYINDLDQIPGQAAIILHKYYDHEYAPYKKAVFVMTADYNKPISDYSDTKVWDKAANDHLLSMWTDIGVDQVTALLSRLTVSVAVIR